MKQHAVTRYGLAFGFAVLATGGLFLLMEGMLDKDGAQLADTKPTFLLDHHFVEEVVVKVKDRKQPKPPKPPELPPLVKLTPAFDPDGGDWSHHMTTPVAEHIPTADTGGSGSDDDILPIMTSPPNYPERAAARGVEGYVVVQFTVDKLGRVVEPIILEAQPNGIFNRAALEAVKRYKYKPKVQHGEAVEVSGVKQRIAFELS